MYSVTFFITTTRDNYTKAYEYFILIVLLMFMRICSPNSNTQPFLGLIGLNWSVNFTVPIVQIKTFIGMYGQERLVMKERVYDEPIASWEFLQRPQQ